MSVVFRAADEPVATREDYWRHVLADNIVPMDVRLDHGPGGIRDEIVTGSMGAVRVTETTTGPGEARRTARHIRRSDPEVYQLLVQVDGSVVGEQGGRRVVLAPGDSSLADLSRPFRCVHAVRRAVLVTFPQALLPLPRHEIAQVMGTRIAGDLGTGALVSTVARQLSRIHALIEVRLGDPDLTPAAVAAAHHISVRYLHRLFETEGQTVAGLIRRRRLDRCRRDVLDPALAHRPVHATASRWGFVSSAHFSRVFRDAYGLPPDEYRRGSSVGEQRH